MARAARYGYRLILERGIRLSRLPTGHYQYAGADGPTRGELLAIIGALDLRPVCAAWEDSAGDYSYRLLRRGVDIDLTLPYNLRQGAGSDLDRSIQRLGDLDQSRLFRDFWLERRLEYISRAVSYHATKLALRYAEVVDWVATRGGSGSEDFWMQDQFPPYFEFEALVTTAVRAWETTRFPIWSSFGADGSTPSSLSRVLDRCVLPVEYRERFDDLRATSERAKSYRDCLAHYVHFGARLPVRVTLLADMAWSVSAWIPDNPEAKSYDKLAYGSRIDALSYACDLATAVVETMELTLEAISAARLRR